MKDIDFARSQLCVRQGKGRKDRFTTLPSSLRPVMTRHLAEVRALHRRDLAQGYGRAPLPHALDRKLGAAARDWHWQWVFAASRLSRDPRSGHTTRHHLPLPSRSGQTNVESRLAGRASASGRINPMHG